MWIGSTRFFKNSWQLSVFSKFSILTFIIDTMVQWTSNKIWHIHSIKSELFEGSKTAHNIPEVFHYVSLWWWSHLEIKLKGVVWWKKGTFNFRRIEFLMYFYIWKIFIILFSIKTCSSYMLTQIHGVPWHFLSLFHKTYHCRH